MTIAELHGKISRTGKNLHDQLEDLLTSEIFSVCKYTKPESLLIPFLESATTIEGDSLEKYLPKSITNIEYHFWPRLKRSEPDVLIGLQDQQNNLTIILIEAKYLSGKSSSAYEEEELILAATPKDQLAREYLDLHDSHLDNKFGTPEVIGRHLVYVTANRTLPKQSIEESKTEISYFISKDQTPSLFWTNWYTINPILSQNMNSYEDWEKPILHDLMILLEHKGMIFFNGLSVPQMVKHISFGTIYSSKKKRVRKKFTFAFSQLQSLESPIFYGSKLNRSQH